MLPKFLGATFLGITLACASPSDPTDPTWSNTVSQQAPQSTMHSADQPLDSGLSDLRFHDLTFVDIHGKSRSMSEFKGRYVLIVNTASECGYTPQYKDLQALHQQYGSKITVIGFPCNDFGGQEPGDEKAIEGFCSKNYGVDFLMASKISIQGENRHPVYRWLMSKSLNGLSDAVVRWNFTKFLVNGEGQWIATYPSSVSPMDAQIIKQLP